MSDDPIDLADYRVRKARRKNSRGSASGAAPVAPNKPSFRSRRSREPTEPTALPGRGEVPCARCQTPISRNATKCLVCGLHYSGRAEDFAPKQKRARWIILVAAALLLSLLAASIVPL